MTEDDIKTIRAIVREEIERAKVTPHYKGIPLPPDAPVVPDCDPHFGYKYDWRHPGGVPGATS